MGRHTRRGPIGKLNQFWLRYEYKHTTIAIASLTLFAALFSTALAGAIFTFLQGLGYLGALIAGILAASFFTAVPAAVLIVRIAASQSLDPLLLALLIGLGSALGDIILLLFFEERIFYELRPLFRRLKFKPFLRRSRRKKQSAPLLLAGAFIVMTPLPDEIGLGLLGISHYPRVFLLVICLALNTLGAGVVVVAARAFSG